MIAFWDILHALMAIALLGAITHQGFSVWRKPAPAHLFVDRFRAVPSRGYANTVVILYILTFALGCYIYPTFVLDVKGSLADGGLRRTIGLFQLKEHVSVMCLAVLPVYWSLWNRALDQDVTTRKLLTTLIMAGVWWNLVVGHILNNVKGLV